MVSICTDLKPNIFTVVLSGGGVDKGRRTIRFLTDKRSKRCEPLQSNHFLAVNFYDEATKFVFGSGRSLTLYNRDEDAFKAWFTKSSDELALKYDICSAWN